MNGSENERWLEWIDGYTLDDRPPEVYGDWEVDVSLISEWFGSLDQGSKAQVAAAIHVLTQRGPSLGRPLVDTVRGSKYNNMKELRPGSTGRSELRILFAFDYERQAIMLVAGDKSRSWNRWYRKSIREAERLLDEHLERSRGSN